MHILLATRIFTPEPAAASFRLQALVSALRAAGHKVTVLTTRAPGRRGAGAVSTGVKRWPVLRDAQGYVRGYLPYLSFDLPLAARLLSERADVVVVEPPPTTGAVVRVTTAFRRVPYVYYAADVWSDAAAVTGAPALVVALLRRLETWAMSGAAQVITVSADVEARLRALDVVDITVVPNGIDTQTFTPTGPRPGGRYLVYTGTASEWQGADIFVRAMPAVLASVPDARLVYIGQGADWARIQELAAELEPEAVEFHATMPPGSVAPWLRGAAAAVVSVVPGQGYDFAYPTKILAALASGTPVVYAGTGPAAADIREHRLGQATRYEVAAVADAMISALTSDEDDGERRRLADWAAENRSLAATGRRAADVVLASAGGSR